MEIIGYEVDSGVSHTREQLMQGARQRAEALQVKLRIGGTSADFYVGLEGGLDVVHENGSRRVSSRVGPMLPMGNAAISVVVSASSCPHRSPTKS
jgi:non-canonical (house-cleaning) NTP pyrophosphatase